MAIRNRLKQGTRLNTQKVSKPQSRIILAVSSNGGHLLQLYQLRKELVMPKVHVVWVTFPKRDSLSLLANKFLVRAYYPTNRGLINTCKNFILAMYLFFRLKPGMVLSTGAGVAIPFLVIARLFSVRSVFIESFARTTKPSMTGGICYWIANVFIYQWKDLQAYYPKGTYGGTVY